MLGNLARALWSAAKSPTGLNVISLGVAWAWRRWASGSPGMQRARALVAAEHGRLEALTELTDTAVDNWALAVLDGAMQRLEKEKGAPPTPRERDELGRAADELGRSLDQLRAAGR